MKFKNLKINKKLMSKLTSFILVGSLSTTLIGCSTDEDKNVIKSSNLHNILVVTRSDGTIDIAKEIHIHESLLTLNYEHRDHEHYKSLITDEIYSTTDCDIDEAVYTIFPIASAGNMNHYSTLSPKIISSYLTKEESLKIESDNFTQQDCEQTFKRIIENTIESVNSTQEDITETVTDDNLETEDVQTYDLTKLYISETISPNNDSKMSYIFEQMDYVDEFYREYQGEFFTVSKDSYYAKSGYETNFQDWNPDFVISNSIEPLSMYLTEEETKLVNNGTLTNLQINNIINRIRTDYNNNLENTNKTYQKRG